MKITQVEFPVDLLDDIVSSTGVRPPGLHLGVVIRDLANRTVHKGKREALDKSDPKARKTASAYFEMGFLWELLFEWVWHSRIKIRLGQTPTAPKLQYQMHGVKAGGMWMTPDAIDGDRWEMWEFKLTWKSVKRLDDLETDPSFWEWLVQIKCYLRALKMSRCHLVAMFVNGDYDSPRVPDPRHLILDFDKRDLDECWTMVMNHKQLMMREGKIRQ